MMKLWTQFNKAIALGFLSLLLAATLSEVASPSAGHRIDINNLPAEAQAIVKERPGVPISSEQWKRLDEVMARNGGWPDGISVFLASVRESWFWFLALPLFGVSFLFLKWKAITPLHAVAVFAPSVGFLLTAILATV